MTAPVLLRPALFDGVPGVAAAFTTRHGGVSAPPYASLNLGLSTDDDPAHVHENRRRVAAALGFAPEALALAGQVHGAAVRVVTAPGLYPGFDGLVTATPGLLLGITAADCAAVLLADADAGVVGACHAGWRGTVAGVVPATLDALRTLGARPERLRAYVGPCISARHFEVGPEVAARFDAAFVLRTPGQKPHVDLKAAVEAQLRQGGIPPDHIEVSARCTFAETHTFFSHRAEHGRTGRMMGLIGLRA
ncbi:MAG: peptidoglycan editing factor PgeF [Bacteroidetes bacterium]|nr:MAG: peptidoglycan editing factor PgeF [Bacteroidota bacterium]